MVAAVISRGAELLVCQRPAHKQHGGLWEFPGGKCEPGESDADAVARELKEELNVDVSAIGEVLFVAHEKGSPYEIAFIATEIVGEPVCVEHDALLWAEPQALLQLPLAPSDRRFLEHQANRL